MLFVLLLSAGKNIIIVMRRRRIARSSINFASCVTNTALIHSFPVLNRGELMKVATSKEACFRREKKSPFDTGWLCGMVILQGFPIWAKRHNATTLLHIKML